MPFVAAPRPPSGALEGDGWRVFLGIWMGGSVGIDGRRLGPSLAALPALWFVFSRGDAWI